MKTENKKKVLGTLVVLGLFTMLPLLTQGANNVDVIGNGTNDISTSVSKLDAPESQIPEEKKEMDDPAQINPPQDVVSIMGTDNPIVGPPLTGPFIPMASEQPIIGPPIKDYPRSDDGPMDGTQVEVDVVEDTNLRGVTATSAYYMV